MSFQTENSVAPPALELREVVFRVPERTILNGINLTVPAGALMSIMGGSGCGKTTLLRTMIGLNRAQEGELLVAGQNLLSLTEAQLNELRKQMGMVFQYAALFDSLTVWENVAFGLLRQRRPRGEINELVLDLLDAVGLRPEVAELYPAEISGGMQKRVGMARALALNPKIVLYDEPTSGLDPVMATTIDELIVSLRDKYQTTAVIVSHHVPSILRISDRVAMLHEGKIIAVGSPHQLRETTDPRVRQFLEGRTDGPLTADNSDREEA